MADPATTLSIVLGVVLCGLFTMVVLTYSSYWQSRPKSGAQLPKGSFGWPIIGETFAVGKDPLDFAISRQKRYGSIFKSSIVMNKSIVGTTPEFAKFVLLNPDLFPVTFSKSIEFMIPNVIRTANEPFFTIRMKTLFVKFGLPRSVQTMMNTLEGIIVEHLASWEEQEMVVGSEVVEKLVADMSSYVAFGIKNIRHTAEGRSALKNMITAFETLYSLPVNLPGTAHSKGRKAVSSLRLYLHSMLQERRSQSDSSCDMTRLLLDTAQEETLLDDDTIVEHMMGIWMGAYRTTATTMTWALKFFIDYPDIFRRVQAEQQEILTSKNLSVDGPNITFSDTEDMVYTTKFFQEVQRVLSSASFVMRKAAQDIEYDGLLLPKGWAVFPMFNFVHFDPANYEYPTSFNPDRWDAPGKPNTYLPFGNEQHRCPGEQIATLETLVYIHHLTTRYTYENVGPDLGTRYKGQIEIVGGYPIKIRRRN